MLSRQVKLPNQLQRQKILDRTWFYTKLRFALGIFCMIGYGWGTYNPNKSAIADVNTELDKFYVNKIKEMDLQEPEFTYNNDIQFVISNKDSNYTIQLNNHFRLQFNYLQYQTIRLTTFQIYHPSFYSYSYPYSSYASFCAFDQIV